MSDGVTIEMAVCTECHQVMPTTFDGVVCMDVDCGGTHRMVEFVGDAPTDPDA